MNEIHHNTQDSNIPPMQRVLDSIADCLTVDCEKLDNCVVIPKWNITVAPEIEQLDDRIAVINFHLFCPEWDEPLFECCAACAKDTDTAIGMAMGSFLFCFMQGISEMEYGESYEPVESHFAGKEHRWRMFKSNNVGMGESVGEAGFWDLLKEHIVKRLGNQRMCYVKVFASKAVGKEDVQITGEVRVNDIPSAELGKLVEKVAAEWNVEQFSSQKQFFFLKQEPETTIFRNLTGAVKREALADRMKLALEWLNECENEEQYNDLHFRLVAEFNEITLAEEMLSFLPEIAAENAFPQIEYSEQIRISVGGGEPVECYKSQLADYYPMHRTLFALFSSGVFGEQTDIIYRKLIGNSSIYNCVRQLNEKGGKLENCKLTSLLFNTSEAFEIL